MDAPLSRCLCPRSALLSWRPQRPSSHQLAWHRVTGKGELPAKALDWIGRLATGPQQGGQAEGQTLLEAWVQSVFGFTECRSSEAQRRVQASPRSSSRSGVTSCCKGPGARELLRAFRLRRVPRGVAGGTARAGGWGFAGAGSSACWLWHVLGASGARLPRDRGLGSQRVRGQGALRSRLQLSSPCPRSPGSGSPAVRLERESQVKSYVPASKDSFEFQVFSNRARWTP